jgi:hypothetical protein
MNGTSVQFTKATPGSILHFEVFTGRPIEGVVSKVEVSGPRNFLVHLDEIRELATGAVCRQAEGDPGPFTYNLSHATHVVKSSGRELVIENLEVQKLQDYWGSRLQEAYRCGAVSRKGHRVCIDGSQEVPRYLVRALVRERVIRSGEVKAWEYLDQAALEAALTTVGIIRNSLTYTAWGYPSFVWVNTRKLTKFLSRNLNRFKLDTRKEEKEYAEEQDRIENERLDNEAERYRRSGYGVAYDEV